MVQKPTILIVDDDPISLKLIEGQLNDYTDKILTSTDGLDALEILNKRPDDFDIIILDWLMPEMNGLEVLKKIKKHEILKHIPVIFQTTKAEDKDVIDGFRAGVSYYLTKPCKKQNLIAIVNTAFLQYNSFKTMLAEVHQTEEVLELMKECRFEFRTVQEATKLASLLAKICPSPKKAVLGLWELLFNAVEHGNLGITYEEKSVLNEENIWDDEIVRRLSLPQNVSKKVVLKVEKTEKEIIFYIEDQGDGFDWKKYLNLDTERAFDSHGRGISIARMMSFDKLEYIESGNKVIAKIYFNT